MGTMLKVERSSSGRLTLKSKPEGESVYRDYHPKSGLCGNSDAADFYKKLAREIYSFIEKGEPLISFQDVDDEDDESPIYGFLTDSAL